MTKELHQPAKNLASLVIKNPLVMINFMVLSIKNAE